MTSSDAIELRIDCRNELGETPLWCAEASTLYWIDVTAPGRVFFWNTGTDAVDFWEFPELVTGIDLMDDGGLLVRGTNDIIRFDPVTRRQQRLFTLPDVSGLSRFNDGHCDRAGRLWVGTMSNNLHPGATGIAASAGQIWCIGEGRASSIDAHLSCPNAICWSPDYRTFYIADSGNGWLYAHRFDDDTGTLMQRRPFFSSSRRHTGWRGRRPGRLPLECALGRGHADPHQPGRAPGSQRAPAGFTAHSLLLR